MNYLFARDPNIQWEQLRALKRDWAKTYREQTFYPIHLYPAVRDWNRQAWTSFSTTFNTSDLSRFSRSTSWGGGGGLNFGLFSIGGSARETRNEHRMSSDIRKMHLELEYLRVRVRAPWLTRNVLYRRNWAFDPEVYGNTWEHRLSDGGDPVNGVRPTGRMPLLPHDILVARKVRIAGLEAESDRRFVETEFRSGGGFGWGPFRIGGHYHDKRTEQYVHGTLDRETISIDRPQIIGWMSALLPECPNPDPQLNWETDVRPRLAEHELGEAEASRERDDLWAEIAYLSEEDMDSQSVRDRDAALAARLPLPAGEVAALKTERDELLAARQGSA